MSGRGNRDDGMFKWFRKCVPCFNPAKEQDDRTGRSGDGSSTPRTPRTIQRREDSKGRNITSSNEEGNVAVIEENLKRREDSKGKGIAASSNKEGDVAVIEQNLKRKEDSKGKGIALSMGGGGGGDVVVGSNRGVGNVVGSSSGGEGGGGGGGGESSSNIAEEGAMINLLQFRKCVPCFNPAKEQDDRTGRSGDGNSKGKNIASSKGKGIAIVPNLAKAGFNIETTKIERHCFGDVSAATLKGNVQLEDFSQVEMGRTAVFVGIYDGHGSCLAAEFVTQNLTRILMELIRHTKAMSADHLREAFLRTDAAWLGTVDEQFEGNKYIAGYGTCCLVGVFWRRTLYLANAGDSRAVIARAEEDNTAKFVAETLTRDDNVKHLEVREELLALHPDEPGFIVEDSKGAFRIKGKIQVSKSIGDAYLKSARHNLDDIKRFKLNSPVIDDNPALSADPSTYTILTGPQDRFVIFASDGLWDMMSSEDAVRIVQEYLVQKSPKEGIAERLVIEALTKAAADIGLDSCKYFPALRHHYGKWGKPHDDMSVVVIFFDHTIDQMAAGDIKEVFKKISIIQGSVTEGESNFTALDELVAEEEKEEDMPGLEGGDVVPSSIGGGGDVAGLSGGEGDVAS